VYVGADRHRAGLLAESKHQGVGLHLLDDGFQHRQLARDMDILVVRSSDFRQALLPAGRLREPLSALRRASVLVLRAEEEHLLDEFRRMGLAAAIWIQHRTLAVEPVAGAIAFCGIAKPQEFFSDLRAAGIDSLAAAAWPDHHPYDHKDIDRLVDLAKKYGAHAFVTTEKDAVRITPDQRARLEELAPLKTARLEVRLEEEAAIAASLSPLVMRK
jgi:tetraacyldisaccharide 4'-kinase